MEALTGTFAVKKGLAQMLKGGVIMDVVTPEHARIAEDAGVQLLAIHGRSRACGFSGAIEWDTSKPNGQPRRKLDTSRARDLFGFQARVSGEDALGTPAPSGSLLQLRLYCTDPVYNTTVVATRWAASRIQHVDYQHEEHPTTTYGETATPFVASEQVACSGVIHLNAGDYVGVANDSAYTIRAVDFQFWIARIGHQLGTDSEEPVTIDD